MTARLKSRAGAFGAALLLALLVALPVLAAAPTVIRTSGAITAISPTSITLEPGPGSTQTFTINGDTKIRIDGKPADISVLKVGQRVRVNSDGARALEISNRLVAPPAAPAAPPRP